MLINIEILRKYSLQFGHSESLVIAELSLEQATKEELATRMGRSTRTIQSYLKPLVQAGVISKNPITHAWSLSFEIQSEISEKKSSITNIQTDISNNYSNLLKHQDQIKTENTIQVHREEECCTSTKHPSRENEILSDSSENIQKAARLASMIIFGKPIEPIVSELKGLLIEFQEIDMKVVASAAHVVKKGVRTNPVMMFIATYRNKVKANLLLSLVVSEKVENQNSANVSTKKRFESSNIKALSKKGSFVGGQSGGKYDIFYQMYEAKAGS